MAVCGALEVVASLSLVAAAWASPFVSPIGEEDGASDVITGVGVGTEGSRSGSESSGSSVGGTGVDAGAVVTFPAGGEKLILRDKLISITSKSSRNALHARKERKRMLASRLVQPESG
jgi:hypothetical protein